ncbi:hypothetical protein PWT90_09818 [Aphanocladium album]|nr:hypothetical protein PWT90_09818 [Aphanocladium album]
MTPTTTPHATPSPPPRRLRVTQTMRPPRPSIFGGFQKPFLVTAVESCSADPDEDEDEDDGDEEVTSLQGRTMKAWLAWVCGVPRGTKFGEKPDWSKEKQKRKKKKGDKEKKKKKDEEEDDYAYESS